MHVDWSGLPGGKPYRTSPQSEHRELVLGAHFLAAIRVSATEVRGTITHRMRQCRMTA